MRCYPQIIGQQGNNFGDTVKAVRELKKTLEEEYGSFTSDPGEFQPCCNFSADDWETSYRYNRRVRNSCLTRISKVRNSCLARISKVRNTCLE